MNKGFLRLTFGIIAFVMVLFACFSKACFSVLALWILFGVMGLFWLKCNPYRKDGNLERLFLTAFFVYSIFMLWTNFALIKDPAVDYYYHIDAIKFWKHSEGVKSFSDIFTIFEKNLKDHSVSKYPLFNLICLVIAYLGYILGGNNIIIQTYQSVFLGALSIPYVYLVVKRYTSRNFAFNAATFFLFLGFVSTFSAVYNRDIHVYFIYTYGLYLVLYYDKEHRVLLKLLILFIVAFFIRYESGVFFIVFILLYLYLKQKDSKIIRVLSFILIPFVLIAVVLLFSKAVQTLDYYSNLQAEVGQERGNSLAGAFNSLPFGLKQFGLSLISQTAPLPFYRNFTPGPWLNSWHAKAFTIFRLPEGISGTVWIFVWGCIVYAFVNAKYKFKKISKELKLSFFIAVVYILLTTASIQVRRTFCVYPIVFTLSCYFYYRFSKKQRRYAFQYSLITLLGIYAFYYIIK